MTACEIAALARSALEEEVCLTPKPGLVDRRNNGAHKDMTLHLFLRSAEVLEPFFAQIAEKGKELYRLPETYSFPYLREIGKQAEQAMMKATGGVNTHKGALFSMGLLCASAGRLAGEKTLLTAENLCRTAAQTVSGLSEKELSGSGTHGLAAHEKYGAKGVRGEAESGFYSVRKYGLPIYRCSYLTDGNREKAALKALLSLIIHVEDTNVLHRAGEEGSLWLRAQSARCLENVSSESMEALDDACIERNISPGGCADLLALTLFLLNFPEK